MRHGGDVPHGGEALHPIHHRAVVGLADQVVPPAQQEVDEAHDRNAGHKQVLESLWSKGGQAKEAGREWR